VRLFGVCTVVPPYTDGPNHLIFLQECSGARTPELRGDRCGGGARGGCCRSRAAQADPYRDSPGYREKGAWIHIAPQPGTPGHAPRLPLPEDWEKSAEAILRLVRRCEEHLDQLAEACREFSESPYSKGIQAGLITPILNAVRPEDFCLLTGSR
jgi:5-methylcytosine-specific restriction protein B